jgi:hypothetical protein
MLPCCDLEIIYLMDYDQLVPVAPIYIRVTAGVNLKVWLSLHSDTIGAIHMENRMYGTIGLSGILAL